MAVSDVGGVSQRRSATGMVSWGARGGFFCVQLLRDAPRPAFRLLFAAGASLGIRGGRSSGSCACPYGSHTPYPVGRRRWRRWHADDPRDGGMGNRRCGLSRLDRRPSRRGDAGGPVRGHNSAASRHERGARHRSVAIRRRAILFLVSLALAVHRVRCDLVSGYDRAQKIAAAIASLSDRSVRLPMAGASYPRRSYSHHRTALFLMRRGRCSCNDLGRSPELRRTTDVEE